jgi:Family of unknown function (DUF5681)
MPKEGEEYEVGYGKPPRASRFQKGTSGNPKGRPRGSKNLASIVMRESRRRVRVNGPRGPRTITKLEAVVMQLGSKAALGEARATREFLPLVQRSEEALSAESTPQAVHELDQQVMQSLRRRMEKVNVGSTTSTGGEEE